MGEHVTLIDQFAVEGGKVFIGGFVDAIANAPTVNIALGSWLFDVSTKAVSFFNGSAWG